MKVLIDIEGYLIDAMSIEIVGPSSVHPGGSMIRMDSGFEFCFKDMPPEKAKKMIQTVLMSINPPPPPPPPTPIRSVRKKK